MISALYRGEVVHTRLRPRRHRLRYRVFSLLLDLDEAPSLDLRLLGINRPGLLSFRESDHGEGVAGGLRAWVEGCLEKAGLDFGRPRIEVLCYPRILGYVFNPITVYFCRDRNAALRAILYEVHNTFGERRTYVIPTDDSGTVQQSCPKELYVSPFVPMDCRYDFTIKPPGERVLLKIDEHDAEGLLLVASFSGERIPLTDRGLLGAWLSHPLMTLKVSAAINWEALKLWLKGVRLVPRTPAVERVATSVIVAPSVVADHATGDREPERVG